MFEVNNKDTRTTSVTSGVLIDNWEYIPHLFLVFLSLNLSLCTLCARGCPFATPGPKILLIPSGRDFSRVTLLSRKGLWGTTQLLGSENCSSKSNYFGGKH